MTSKKTISLIFFIFLSIFSLFTGGCISNYRSDIEAVEAKKIDNGSYSITINYWINSESEDLSSDKISILVYTKNNNETLYSYSEDKIKYGAVTFEFNPKVKKINQETGEEYFETISPDEIFIQLSLGNYFVSTKNYSLSQLLQK